LLISCKTNSTTLKMKMCFCETSIHFQRVTLCYIPEGRTFRNLSAERCSGNVVGLQGGTNRILFRGI
jgi:hypothetical protein